MNDIESGAYVRRYYNRPAHKGRAVVLDGHPGVIVGFVDAYMLVLRDGDTEPVRAHPTWRVQYLPGAADAVVEVAS